MSNGALWLIAIAVVVSSVSLVINTVASVATFRVAKKLINDVTPLFPLIHDTFKNANQAIETSITDVRSLVKQGRGVLRDIKEQIRHIDAARTELTEQVKIHGKRIELVTDDILDRAQEVVSVLHNSVAPPIREVNSTIAAVRTFRTFFLVRRGSPKQDDEIFS
jgi:methyl-accepting chemotaxis protein